MKQCLAVVYLSLVFFGLFSGCSSMEPPNVAVTVGDTVLKFELQADQENETPFKGLLDAHGGKDGLYYNHLGDYGKPIEVEIEGQTPDNIRLYDSFVESDGTVYEEEELLSFGKKENGFTFQMKERMPSVSTLTGRIPERGSLMRGFRFQCIYGQEKVNYLFLVRTDARVWQAASKTVVSTGGRELFHMYTTEGLQDFYFREYPVERLMFVPEPGYDQTVSFNSTIDFTFPEDGLPDSAKLINDVMVSDSGNYKYQGDTRSLPLSELTMKDGKLSFIVKPEYFAEGEQNCNVTYVLCTWDGLTSVYTVIFRINP